MPWAQPPGKRVGISNRLTPYKDHPRRTRRDKKEIHEGHEGPRRDTKTDGPPSTTSGAKMLLQYCALGVTMSWDEGFPGARASRPHDDGFPGARASRPHQAWHRLGHLPHLDQPGTAPWLSFGLADGVPADRVAACSIALKLSGGQRDRMRAGRPRSQARPSRRRRADHSRKNSRSFMKMNHEWTRINTKGHEDRWISFNHKRRQNASAIWCPWGDDVMG